MFALSVPPGYALRAFAAVATCLVAMSYSALAHAKIDFPPYPDLDVPVHADSTIEFPPYPDLDVPAPAVVSVDRMYGLCDELMESAALDLEMPAVCEQVTETVKRERFDGDFEAYVAWWREQKFALGDALNTP